MMSPQFRGWLHWLSAVAVVSIVAGCVIAPQRMSAGMAALVAVVSVASDLVALWHISQSAPSPRTTTPAAPPAQDGRTQ